MVTHLVGDNPHPSRQTVITLTHEEVIEPEQQALIG
jgi:hypothetical protein